MIKSIQNIKLNVFQLFLGAAGNAFLREEVSITDADGFEVMTCPLKYYKESSDDLTEASHETYPVISVQDFPVIPVEGWNNYPKKEYGGERYDTSGKLIGTYEIPKPIRLMCKYHVAVASKKDSEYDSICSWFYTNFGVGINNTTVFNAKVLNGLVDTKVGDFVNYKLTAYDNTTRTDGIRETIFFFEFHLWAHFKPQKEVDYFEEISVSLGDELIKDITY